MYKHDKKWIVFFSFFLIITFFILHRHFYPSLKESFLPAKEKKVKEIKNEILVTPSPLPPAPQRKISSYVKPSEKNEFKTAVKEFMTDFSQASGENRGKILEEKLEYLRQNAETILPEILEELEQLPRHHQSARTTLFLVLGELGFSSQEARQNIQTVIDQELSRPNEEPTDIKKNTVDLHHDIRFVEKEDGLYLSNASTKLAAIDTLRTMGDAEAIQKLIEIAKDPSQPKYLRNAADDAILSFLDPAEAAKIKASSK